MSLLRKIELDQENISSKYSRRKLVLLMSSILLLGAILEIWTVNRLSSFGDQINKLEEAKQELTLENQILSNEIAKKQSLSQVEGYAKSLGFSSSSNVVYLRQEDLALNR